MNYSYEQQQLQKTFFCYSEWVGDAFIISALNKRSSQGTLEKYKFWNTHLQMSHLHERKCPWVHIFYRFQLLSRVVVANLLQKKYLDSALNISVSTVHNVWGFCNIKHLKLVNFELHKQIFRKYCVFLT